MCSRLAHEKHARAEAVARLEQLKSRRDALAAIAAQRSDFLCSLQVRCSGHCLPLALSKVSFVGVTTTSSRSCATPHQAFLAEYTDGVRRVARCTGSIR